ncbi:MAG: radical SAM protein [Deltaproteobacteria bacterium]|nr:radical SAM protein [Deltaproteobacteria bacterium]
MNLRHGLRAGRRLLRGNVDDRVATAIFFVTDDCNARCDYCFNTRLSHRNGEKTRGRRLDADELRQIARHLGRLYQVILSGGEPFLRRDLGEVLRGLLDESRPAIVTLPTNGSLPERVLPVLEEAAREHPATVFNLGLSLDAVGEAHDQLRRLPGGYAKALGLGRAVQRLGQRLGNVNLVVNSLATRETLDGLPALFEALASAFEGAEWFHNLQFDQRLQADPLEDPALEEQLRRLQALEREARERRAGRLGRLIEGAYVDGLNALLRRQLGEGRMIYACNAGRKLIVVASDGTLSPCEPFLFEEHYAARRSFDLREHGLDFYRLRATPEYRAELEFIEAGKCAACPWSCAAITSLLFEPGQWQRFWVT